MQRVEILIVAHDSALRQTFHELMKNDYNITEAEDSAEAILLMKNRHFDIVIISIYANNASNLELIKQIKSNPLFEHTAILVCGDSHKPDDLAYAVKNGALYNFVYPINPSYIREVINNISTTFLEENSSLKSKVKERENHLKSFLDASPGGMVTVVKKDKYYITYISAKTMKFLGYGDQEMTDVQYELKNYTHPDDWDALLTILEVKLAKDDFVTIVARLKKADNTYVPMEVAISANNNDGERTYDFVNYYIAAESDRERFFKRQITDYQKQVMIDPLTGIYNRESFYLMTRKMVEEHPEYDYIMGVFNIDRFKSVNELFGTATGDKIIVEFADLIRRTMDDATCTYGRLESDHFVICVPEERFLALERELDLILDGRYDWNSLNYQIFLHIGLYRLEKCDKDITICCDRANMALQMIKESFVYRKRFFSKEMRDSIILEQEIMQNADKAIDNKEFFVTYQPIVNAKTKEIVAAEALIRWKREDGSIVSPGDFIPVFERNGYVSKLDMYVWDSICAFQADRVRKGLNVVPISVNLSRIDFYNPYLFEQLTSIVESYGLSSECLKVEITESAYMDQPQELLEVIEKFKSYGFKVLMDDFGSGFSSLNMLKDVNVDVLKIDMRFMDTIDTSERASNILFSIIQMAKAIHMEIVAEGVETVNQYNLLLGMDCDNIQGYYFYKPLAEDAFADKLENNLGNMSTNALDMRPSLVYLKGTESDDDFCDVVGQEFSIHIVNSCDEAAEYLRRAASSTSLCVVDFDSAPEECRKFIEHMSGNAFYSEIPIMAVVSSETAEAVMGEYVGNGIADSIGRPLHPTILRQRIKNTINYNDIMLEKRAVNILKKNVQLKQQMNTFFEDSFAGVAKFILDQDNPTKIKEVLYANSRFLELHDISLEDATSVSDIGVFFRNGITEDIGRLFEQLKKTIELKKTNFVIEYRVENNSGKILKIIASGTIRYRGNDVITDLIFLENSFDSEQEIKSIIEVLGKYTLGEKKISVWKYYPADNLAEYFRRTEEGKYIKSVVHNAMENAISQVGDCEEAKEQVRGFFEGFNKGETSCSTTIYVSSPKNSAKKEERWVKMSGELVEDASLRKCVIAVSEVVSDDFIILRNNFRSSIYMDTVIDDCDEYLEFDIRTGEILSENRGDVLAELGLPNNSVFDDVIAKFAKGVGADEYDKLMSTFSKYSLISRFESGEKYASVDVLYSKDGNSDYEMLKIRIRMYKNPISGRLLGAWCVFNLSKNGRTSVRSIEDHDSVTGLYNRVMLEKTMNRLLAESDVVGANQSAAFAVIDIDNFKYVNDVFGHNLGDSILKTFAKLIYKSQNDNFFAARLGGDEFGLFVYGIDDRKQFEESLEKLRTDSVMTLSDSGNDINITISIGIVYVDENNRIFRKLYSRADEAMKSSKTDGKNKCSVYGI